MNRTIDLELSSGKKKLLLVSDLFTSLILLQAGFETLQSGSNLLLASVNILSGGSLLAVGIREWRSIKKILHNRIQWLDVVSGLVMMINTGIMYKPWKGFQPAYIYALLSIFLILKGFSLIRKPGFRKLIISDRGFKIRTGAFSKLYCSWTEVEQVLQKGKTLIVVTNNGERQISMRNIENKNEAYAALVSSLHSIKKQ